MQMKQQEEDRAEGDKQLRHHLQAIIGERVLSALGEPSGLHRIQVRKLWDDRYRVNVFTGADAASAIIVHSFFLLTDSEGNIITANPKITKHY